MANTQTGANTSVNSAYINDAGRAQAANYQATKDNSSSAPQKGTSGVVTTPSVSSNGVVSNTPTTTQNSTSVPTTSYAVVTPQPAVNTINGISNSFQNIKDGMTTQAETNAKQETPTIPGYSVSPTATGAQGEVKAVYNATGQSYFITPQAKPATAGDIASTLSAGSSGTTSDTTPNKLQQENTDFKNQFTQIQNEKAQAYSDYKSSVDQLRNGTFPLTPAQQALVDATSKSFDQMIRQANLKGAAVSSMTGGFGNKVGATLGELSNIESSKALALAKLETGFQDQNYKLINDSYQTFVDLEKSKTDALSTLHKDVVDQATAERTYNLDIAKFQQTGDQNAFDRAFKVEQQTFDEKYKTEQQKIEREKNSLQYGANNLAAGLSAEGGTKIGTDGKIDQTSQDAFYSKMAATYGIATANQIKDLANYKADPTIFSTRSGMTRSVADSLARLYDPTYDSTEYKARAAFNKLWESGGLASSNNAVNVASQHLGELYKAGVALKNLNGGTDPFTMSYDNFKNWLSKNAGNPQITNFNTALNFVSGEVAKAVKNGVNSNAAPAKEEIDAMKEQILSGSSGQQINGFIETTANLIGDRANVNAEQYKQIMGKDAPSVYLPTTLSKLGELKNSGLNINIQGVNYTDPKSYVSASPENATKFSDTATKLGTLFPGRTFTPEEILQAVESVTQ